MGNCFGKESGNFSGEGRTLGAQGNETTPLARPVGKTAQPKTSSYATTGRTLGTGSAAGSLSPKEAAAKAAETRAAAAQGSSKGVLGQKLNQQRQQSQTATLAQNARDNLAARDADTAAQARSYN